MPDLSGIIRFSAVAGPANQRVIGSSANSKNRDVLVFGAIMGSGLEHLNRSLTPTTRYGMELIVGHPPDTRSTPRKALRRPAKILANEVALMTGVTTDISVDGMCLITPEQLSAGKIYVVAFDIPVGAILKKINIGGKVTYCVLKGMDGYRTGMKFMMVQPATMDIIRKFFEEKSD
jgi:hypothetical protein